MGNMEVLETTYFERNAQEMLRNAGYTKAAFAEKMGVAAQNVNKTIATKNVYTLMKIAKLLGVSLDMVLTGGETEKCSIDGFVEINGETFRLKCREDLVQALEKVSQPDDNL